MPFRSKSSTYLLSWALPCCISHFHWSLVWKLCHLFFGMHGGRRWRLVGSPPEHGRRGPASFTSMLVLCFVLFSLSPSLCFVGRHHFCLDCRFNFNARARFFNFFYYYYGRRWCSVESIYSLFCLSCYLQGA